MEKDKKAVADFSRCQISQSVINLPLNSHFWQDKDLWNINKIKVIVNNIVFKYLRVNIFEELLLY